MIWKDRYEILPSESYEQYVHRLAKQDFYLLSAIVFMFFLSFLIGYFYA